MVLLVLCLISSLVEVHSEMQPVPYITFLDNYVPNHGYLDIAAVGSAVDGSDSVKCHTDLSTCCRYTQGTDRGDWYAPGRNGRLPFPNDHKPLKMYESRGVQLIDLRQSGESSTFGVYRQLQ